MGTPGERKALLFFGAVLLFGGSVRAARAVTDADGVDHRAASAIDRQIAAVDSVRKNGKSRKGKRKQAAKSEAVPAVIDLDVASAAEIETLRGIGPALAQRIVADRDSLGPFGSLGELQRVKGVGPRLAAKVESGVTFSLHSRRARNEISRLRGRPPGRARARRGEARN